MPSLGLGLRRRLQRLVVALCSCRALLGFAHERGRPRHPGNLVLRHRVLGRPAVVAICSSGVAFVHACLCVCVCEDVIFAHLLGRLLADDSQNCLWRVNHFGAPGGLQRFRSVRWSLPKRILRGGPSELPLAHDRRLLSPSPPLVTIQALVGDIQSYFGSGCLRLLMVQSSRSILCVLSMIGGVV